MVTDWLSRLSDAPGFDEVDALWAWVGDRYGGVADALKGTAERRLEGDLSEDFYAMKNDHLQLSLDVGIGFSRSLYQAQLERLVEIAADLPQPRRILDPGCENGLLTCFYGLLWPTAEVIGVDLSAEAISCAQALRERERVDNVAFHALDTPGPTIESLGAFDLVLASRTMLFERMGIPTFLPPVDAVDIASMPKDEAPEGWGYVRAIVDALEDHGILMSLERCGSPQVLPQWLAGIRALDLAVEWEKSGWLPFNEVGEVRAEPLLVLSRPGAAESWHHTIDFLLTRPAESTWPMYLWASVEDRTGPREHLVGVQLDPIDGGRPQSIFVETTESHIFWLSAEGGVLSGMTTYPVAMAALVQQYLDDAVSQAEKLGEVTTF